MRTLKTHLTHLTTSKISTNRGVLVEAKPRFQKKTSRRCRRITVMPPPTNLSTTNLPHRSRPRTGIKEVAWLGRYPAWSPQVGIPSPPHTLPSTSCGWVRVAGGGSPRSGCPWGPPGPRGGDAPGGAPPSSSSASPSAWPPPPPSSLRRRWGGGTAQKGARRLTQKLWTLLRRQLIINQSSGSIPCHQVTQASTSPPTRLPPSVPCRA